MSKKGYSLHFFSEDEIEGLGIDNNEKGFKRKSELLKIVYIKLQILKLMVISLNNKYSTTFFYQSALKYYNYLKDNNLNIEFLTAKACEQINDEEFILYFDKKVKSFSFIESLFLDNNIEIQNFSLSNETEESVHITVAPDITKKVKNSKTHKLKIDFLALVKIFINLFYEKTYVRIPQTASFDASLLTLQPLIDITPSPEQFDAIKNALTSPLSYIWGTAGSGKTRVVLAYCAILMAKQGKRILITAPTNVALENVLMSIIPLAEKNGIPPTKIIRKGNPSLEFIRKYPMCCPLEAFNKNLAYLKEKKSSITKYIDSLFKLNIYLKTLPVSLEYNATAKELKKLQKNIEDLHFNVNSAKAKMISTDEERHNVSKLITAATKRVNNFTKIFLRSSYTKSQAELHKHYTLLDTLNTEYENTKLALNELEASLKNNEEKMQKYKLKLSEQKKQISSLLNKLRKHNLTEYALEMLTDELERLISLISQALLETTLKYSKVTFFSKDYINSCETEIKPIPEDIFIKEKNNLTNVLSEVDFDIKECTDTLDKNNKLIVGVTLDNYATDTDENFMHIFLDEACYANLIKTVPLFLSGAPITFLGDNMQIPPVSQVKERVIDKFFVPWMQSGIYAADVIKYGVNYLPEKVMEQPLPQSLSCSNIPITYRYSQQLADILNIHIYKLPYFKSMMSGTTKISIISVPKTKSEKNVSRANIDEALSIKEFLANNKIEDFVIITPYRKQEQLILQTLNNHANVLTVHKAQGQEWKTVLLSVSDTDKPYYTNSRLPIGKKLLNTAISRAKENLIIFCDADCWKTKENQLITDLINTEQ